MNWHGKIQSSIAGDSDAAILYSENHQVDFLLCRVVLDNKSGYEVLLQISVEARKALMISEYSRTFIRCVRGFDNNVPLLIEPKAHEVAQYIDMLLQS